ncbi:tyrosine-type recombinase/integrase [Streptomyces sp. NBC_00249]|uniref:tyrosine-type recombinase/integrase n=1 Tax=Streptomyces sp. NBC_00249 TaxID=2975690 RepID=UPI00225B6BD3|nr:tyrosine-type recombinase/integrase [Streptomyces sp. NBC_00249]MCX5193318.1 tyrosine-type recombinase/integrase [Streptomyces sp. NBC_00249]
MRTTGDRGRIYRRCGCRDTLHHQLGAHCPHLLADGDHGTWTFAIDVPAPRHRRTTVRRHAFGNHDAAEGALRRFLEGDDGGFNSDPNQSVADYLVRCTLSAIDNNHLVITSPRTRSSLGWVAISLRVATTLQHRARATALSRGDPGDPFAGLAFCRPDSRPLRPPGVLDRLRKLSDEAGVPRVTVHDLRHRAATITAGVPLTVVSKTLRHSTLSTTANVYSHLTQQAAREAVDTIAHTLTKAEKTGRSGQRGCDHLATTSSASAKPSTGSAPPPRPCSAPWRTGPEPGVRPHCDHQDSGHGKAALSRMRERPPTCIKHSRDDRI